MTSTKPPRVGGNHGNSRPKGARDLKPRPLTAKTGNRLRDMADTIDAIAARAVGGSAIRLIAVSAALRAEAKSLGA